MTVSMRLAGPANMMWVSAPLEPAG